MSRQAVTLEKKYRKDYSQFFIFLIPMIFLVIFMLYPMVNTFIRSFWVSSEDLSFHGFTLDNFKQFITSNLYKKSLKNSLIVSVSVMLLSLLIGVPMGYCVARVKMPGKNLILSLGILPIIMPSFVGAFTWIILLGNKGIVRYVLNLVLGPLGIQLPSIYGMAGMIFCMTMTYYPFVFQLSYGAFASANSLLEESAMLMGASRSRIMRTITLPLIMPSIGAGALLVFVRAIGNFGIPAMIGGDTYVLPTLIYFEVNGFWNMNGASAIAVVNVLITVFILWFQKYIVSRHEYETISATHTELKQHESLGARILAIVFCAIILIFSLLPQITIIIMSFFKKWVGLLPTGFTLENYTRIPSYSSHELFNSFFLSITATLLCAIIGSIIAYITERKKPKGAALLEISVMAPFILPGTVVSIALLSAFSGNSIIRLTGTYAIIIISYIIR
ncbi:MAG: iron ABC transporter permease, partial [Sphaerochaetaceae bacterium]|nr:iron ABC transporter permease [Sphaerochaetaceae bacterium]